MTTSLQNLVSIVLLTLAFVFADAYDPSPLQDICVAVKEPEDARKLFFLLLIFSYPVC